MPRADLPTKANSSTSGRIEQLEGDQTNRGERRRTSMQTTMAVEDIKVTLPELLDKLTPGDEVILTRNHKPVAKLVSEAPKPALQQRPSPGLCKKQKREAEKGSGVE
jgi:antitoxin (DNA-binding transcriptional repressor) of toxin-antitoxin stability system